MPSLAQDGLVPGGHGTAQVERVPAEQVRDAPEPAEKNAPEPDVTRNSDLRRTRDAQPNGREPSSID